ncbi:riboflavin synthase [uncultured Rikenella sp.]|uniref:riboflavin synthase n=1 Tax=uncultured Rikenella sp. TaxID=368003 RepID=UPI00261FE695|nr:riboflavin synthase [uncultured Rikenella sp.]
MFSGIVQSMGTVVRLEPDHDNLHITLEADLAPELHIDQSVAHNGVCLTVVAVDPEKRTYTVTAIRETLEKSSLGDLKVGDPVNLERSMRMDALLDGHIVQGHVDTTGVCRTVEFADGSWYYTFDYDAPERLRKAGYVTVEKGSIAVNGVSLTVVNSRPDGFQVAIIPYTHEHTNFHRIEPNTRVNLEFDIIGKYVARLLGTAEPEK